MALSGEHTGSKTYVFSTRITWSARQNATDIANNRSYVTANVYLIIASGGSVDSNASKNGSTTINGSTASFTKSMGKLGAGTHLIATRSLYVDHNSDGTKKFSLSAYFDFNVSISGYGYVGRLSTGSKEYTLDTIPRASTASLGGSSQTNANINVTISRKSSSFRHRVRWKISGSTSWKTVQTSSWTGTSTSFKVQPSDIPNSKSNNIAVGVQTYSGSTAIGSEVVLRRVVTIPNSTASISGGNNTDSGQTASVSNSGGSLSYTYSWKLGSKTRGNYTTWTPGHDALPNATSGTLTLTVVTKNGSATINTATRTKTLSVPSSVVPSFGSITHTEYVRDVSSKVGAYVQSKSRLTLGMTSPSAGSGSSIKSYNFTVGGRKVTSNNGTTAVINQSGNLTITATLTDNRNRSVSKTTTVNFLPYSPPTLSNLSFRRTLPDKTEAPLGDNATVRANVKVQSLIVNGVEKNSIKYHVQSAQTGYSFADKANTTSKNLTKSYSDVWSGYSVDYSYNFRVRAGDVFGFGGWSVGVVPTGIITQQWGSKTTSFGKMIDNTSYNVQVGTGGIQSDGPIIDKNGAEPLAYRGPLPSGDTRLNSYWMAVENGIWYMDGDSSRVEGIPAGSWGTLVKTTAHNTGIGTSIFEVVYTAHKRGSSASLHDRWIITGNVQGISPWRRISMEGHTHSASDINSGTIADARLPAKAKPADYVIETGSNSYGSWEKWASGKMIQWGVTRIEPAPSTTTTHLQSFPIPFVVGSTSKTIGITQGVETEYPGNRRWGYTSITPNTFRHSFYYEGSVNYFLISWTAVGRWK